MRRRLDGILILCLALLAPVDAEVNGNDSRATIQVQVTSASPRLTAVEFRRDALRGIRVGGSKIRLNGLPLPGDALVDLELQRFHVTRPDTQFFVGRRDGVDRAISFDSSRFTLLRGQVIGYPGSHVVLSLSDLGSVGRVELGPGGRQFDVFGKTSVSVDAPESSTHRLSIRPARADGPPPWVPICGVPAPTVRPEATALPAAMPAGQPLPSTMRVVELAVETDYEFYELFGDTTAAADYIVELYAMVSAIYMRDLHTRIELTYVRVWDSPDDLFNDPDPLVPFRNHWNGSMSDVHRDAAQFVTGRRDLPYGGVAYLSALCESSGYSVAGYILGALTDPSVPSVGQWDVVVTAHELGHNCGTLHTHDGYNPRIDECGAPFGVLSRGTIMSYCHTLPGGNANVDLRFHARVQQVVEAFVANRACVIDDCNANSVDDLEDIFSGSSTDANANDIPDDCEDCNDNGLLDGDDIASATSTDTDANGVPDDCQPDCNANGVPDAMDITAGTSEDVYGDSVPDECALDCNGNDLSDYNEIVAHMDWDLNRNAMLDACEDCDGDGIIDAEALAGAHALWVTSSVNASAKAYHPGTGVFLRASAPGVGESGQDLVIRDDGMILVSSALDDRIIMYAQDGAFVGDLVASGSGGLDFPTSMVLSSDGRLLVSSAGNNSIFEFNAQTGAFVSHFVEPNSAGLALPYGLAFSPAGNLVVCSAGNDSVYEFDGQSGAFIRVFVDSGEGGLSDPRGLTFKPDGNLLVTSFESNEVLEYDGQSGQFVGRFDRGGLVSGFWALQNPWQIRIGPNGNVYVSSNVGNAGIHMYDGRTGAFMRTFYVLSGADLTQPSGFDFAPGWSLDCNLNLLPDSCDIADGYSADADANSVPDECDTDCNQNGHWDRLDLIPYGPSYDVNFNGVPDECESCSSNDDCDDGNNCTFDQCTGGWCTDKSALYGDVAGAGGSCGPDGVVDLSDITAILDAFQGIFRDGCTRANIDLTSQQDDCGRDGKIQLKDILAVLDAFAGVADCCP